MSANTDVLNINSRMRVETSSNNQTIDVGIPRHSTGWSTAIIRYHNFPQLPTKKGESVDSAPFSCHGLDWYLRIHPGGASSADGDGMVSLYLRCKSAAESNCAVQAEFSLSLLRQGGDGQIEMKMSCPCNAFRRKRKGWPNFIARSRVLDPRAYLLDSQGTLSVVVQVQLFQEKDTNFVPRNDLNLFKLLKEANPPLSDGNGSVKNAEDSATANTADVKLSVAGEIFHAHRLILKLAAPALAHLCEDADDEECILVPGVRVSTPYGRHALLTSEQSSLNRACLLASMLSLPSFRECYVLHMVMPSQKRCGELKVVPRRMG